MRTRTLIIALFMAGLATAGTARQSDRRVERVALLAQCGFDDWFRPVEELDSEDLRALTALLPVHRYEEFSEKDLKPDASGVPTACAKIRAAAPTPVAAPVAAGVKAAVPACAPHCFTRTLPPASTADHVRFAVIGDSGDVKQQLEESGESIQSAVARHVREVCAVADAGCAFAVFLGDNLYPDGLSHFGGRRERDEKRLRAFIDSYGLPAYVTLGNHDWHPLWASRDRAERMLGFIHGQSGVFGNALFYDFDAGPATLWSIDTNYLVRVKEARETIESEPWLKRIAASTSRWKIAFGHHPYLSNGSHGNAGEFRDGAGLRWRGDDYKRFLERNILDRMDLVLSGHDHNLQFYPVSRRDKPGAALLVSGAAAKCKGQGRSRNTGEDGTVAPSFEHYGPGFSVIDAGPDRLTVEIHWRDHGGWAMWSASKVHNGTWTAPPRSRHVHPCAG